MNHRNFTTGARSLNEQDLHDNLTYIKSPQSGIESITSRSKLAFKIFDEYENILKFMYSTRFKGCPRHNDTHDQMDIVLSSKIHDPMDLCDGTTKWRVSRISSFLLSVLLYVYSYRNETHLMNSVTFVFILM